MRKSLRLLFLAKDFFFHCSIPSPPLFRAGADGQEGGAPQGTQRRSTRSEPKEIESLRVLSKRNHQTDKERDQEPYGVWCVVSFFVLSSLVLFPGEINQIMFKNRAREPRGPTIGKEKVRPGNGHRVVAWDRSMACGMERADLPTSREKGRETDCASKQAHHTLPPLIVDNCTDKERVDRWLRLIGFPCTARLDNKP